MKSSRRCRPMASYTGAAAAPDPIDDGKLTKHPHLAHNSLSPDDMSLRMKRLLEQDHQQEGSIVKKTCTSLVSQCLLKVPVLKLHKLKLDLDHHNTEPNEHTPDDGSGWSKPTPSPLAHKEVLACNVNITNHQQPDPTEKTVCTSPPVDCSKVPVVRLIRLNIQTETQEEEPSSECDTEQHHDQEPQKTKQQEVPCVNDSSTSLEEICRRKQPVVKLSRLKTPLEEQQLRKSSCEQHSAQVPTPSNGKTPDRQAPSLLAQNLVLPRNRRFTRKHDQQEGDTEEKSCGSLERICSKQPVVHLIRLNKETKNQCQATDEGDGEHHHDHVQSLQPEHREEQPMDDSDSDQFDEQDLKMLSAYEIKRLKNIKENAKFLKSLKLLEVPLIPQPRRRRLYPRKDKAKRAMIMRRSIRLQERTFPLKIPAVKKQIMELPKNHPLHPIEMIPSNEVDSGAWLSFQDTWRSISIDKCAKASSFKCKNLKSYAKCLQSLTLKDRAITHTVPGSVVCLALHPSTTRTLVATGDNTGNVALWDLKHQSEGVYIFPLYSTKVRSIAFSPSNPQHLLSLSYEGTIRCADLSHTAFNTIYCMNSYLTSFDFLSADGSVLLVSHSDSKLCIVDRRTRNTSHNAFAYLDMKYVRSVNVHPLKRDLCVVAGDDSALIYDVRKLSVYMPQTVMTLLGHRGKVLSASFSPATGKNILTYSLDTRVRVFRSEFFDQSRHPFKTHRFCKKLNQATVPIAWDPKQENCFGHGLLGSGQINIVHTFGQCIHTLASPSLSATPTVLAIHPTRKLVVAGTQRGVVAVWKKWQKKPNPPEENKSL